MRCCALLALAALMPLIGRALCLPVVKAGEMAETVVRKCPGTVVAVSRVDVVPQVSGEILEVGFRNGQAVKKGDVLFRLDPAKYNAAVKNAEAKVAEAKAVREYAELTLKRYEELVKTRAVSQDDYDKARSTRETSIATLTAAEADLLAAEDDLAHCTIVAPISGRVGSTAYTEGNYMMKGGPVMVTLVQEDPIRVRFRISGVDYRDVYGSDRARIESEGVPAIRLVATDRGAVTGKVEYVENVVDRATDTVCVYALLDNGGGKFLDGQVVMVDFGNRGGRLLPALPQTAVVQDTMGPFVWVVDAQGVAEKRRIVRGISVGRNLLVAEGLAVGESVVADGVHRVRSGMRIEAEAAK